jgi:hypothetical protein
MHYQLEPAAERLLGRIGIINDKKPCSVRLLANYSGYMTRPRLSWAVTCAYLGLPKPDVSGRRQQMPKNRLFAVWTIPELFWSFGTVSFP